MNRIEWAQGWLDSLSFPKGVEDQCGYPSNIVSIVTWINSEGSIARNNPLDTEYDMTGATNYNSAGVKNYPSLAIGYSASSLTLMNGYYPQLLNCLKVGAIADSTVAAIYASPWGSKPTQQMLNNVRSKFLQYGSVYVSGTPTDAPPTTPKEEDMGISNQWLVRQCYREVLHREVDPQGFATWMGFLAAGGDPGTMWADIQDSTEGQAVLAAERRALGL